MATKPSKKHPWKQHNYDTKKDRIARGEHPVVLAAPLQLGTNRGRSERVGRVR